MVLIRRSHGSSESQELTPSESACAYCRIRNTVEPFCKRFLQEDVLNVFSIVRFWMHDSTTFCLANKRPYLLQWHQETLVIQTNKITKDSFALNLRNSLDELEKLVEENVLFGISLQSIGVSCELHHSMDNGDDVTPGYGPFSSGTTTALDNPDSDKFFRVMMKIADRSPCRRVGGSLEWDREKSLRWETEIHQSLQLAFVQTHATCGLTGRGAEAALYNWTNEAFGSRHHLRIHKGTCALDGNYHKGTFTTGLYKNILRVLPYRVAQILFILLRVIRPIQLMSLMKFIIPAGKTNIEAATKLYATRIFVSWNKPWPAIYLSHILMAWFHKHHGFKIGLRMYHHFATALQRRYIKYRTHDNPEDIQELADTQAGRQQKTGDLYYAVEKGKSSSESHVCGFELMSAYWHEMIRYETYPPK